MILTEREAIIMKLPKKAQRLCFLKHEDNWYQITKEDTKYSLYKCENPNVDNWWLNNEFTYICTSNSYEKLEKKINEGKI